ncbi:MAG TPA: hypothetical protein VFZ61_18260 [Polyangiales bacterium]
MHRSRPPERTRALVSTGPLAPRSWLRGALLILAACGADDGTVDEPDHNPSLEHWCGARPCGWQLDLGEVARVSSWHERDYAVELAGSDSTRLSQLRNSTPSQCITFDMVARVAEDTKLTLLLDFNDDGKNDVRQAVSEQPWKSVRFSIPTPTFYDRVRFILLKEGTGRALVAQIVIAGEDECPTFPLRLEAGSRCEDDSVCDEGLVCAADTCQDAEAVRLTTGSE